MFGFFPQGHHPFPQGHPFGQQFEEEEDAQEEVENTELYEILGVPPQSEIAIVKKAYLKLAKEKHPDRGGDKLEFQKIQKSYDVLKDPKLKEVYDQHGINGLKKQGGRRKQDQQSKCQQIVIPLELTLEEVYQGLTKYEKVKINKICNDCQGTGGKNSSLCSFCRGQKFVQLNQEIAPGMYISQPGPCPTCRGTGSIIKEEDACKICQGKGTVQTETDVEIVIEKGVAEGHIIKLYGKGNEKAGSLQGDIFVEVAIKKHDQFNRKGSDLFLTKSITLKDALLGVNFTIKHLDGELITIKSDQIISPNRILSVPGLGMPTYRDEMNKGDLNIQFNIVFPVQLSDQDREIIKKLSLEVEHNDQAGKVFKLEAFSMERHEKNSKLPEDDEDEDGVEQQCRMF